MKVNPSKQQKNTSLNTLNVKNNALFWWNKLTKSKQRDYEFTMFGYGDFFEDNSLCDNDIINMFNRYK